MPEDQDPRETQEWREALDSVVEFDGVERAAFLLKELQDEARRHAVPVPFSATTAYANTIPVDKQQRTNVAHIFAIGDVVGRATIPPQSPAPSCVHHLAPQEYTMAGRP